MDATHTVVPLTQAHARLEALNDLANNTESTAVPKPGKVNWINVIVLTSTPLIAAVSLTLYVFHWGFSWGDFLNFAVMYVLCGMAITGGYHRYYAHRSYRCSAWVEVFYLAFGAAALQNSVLFWASDHRFHHRHVDKVHDPYNIRKGFWWAHIFWIFFEDAAGTRNFNNVPDLRKNRLVVLQDKLYVPLAILVGLGIPFLIGLAFGRPGGGLIWGGVLRLVFGHHCTFLINSAAHFFGKQPYSKANSARDSGWLAFFSYGEGYHNFHHTFPGDYRNGIAWYHWDPTKWMIQGFHRLGLASGLHRTSQMIIDSAKAREAGYFPEKSSMKEKMTEALTSSANAFERKPLT